MLFLKNVLGLDLGSHSLKAVELRQTLRGIEAVSLRSLRRGDPETSLSELVEGLVRTHGLSVENVVSAIPSDRISARRLEFPFRDRRRLARLAAYHPACRWHDPVRQSQGRSGAGPRDRGIRGA